MIKDTPIVSYRQNTQNKSKSKTYLVGEMNYAAPKDRKYTSATIMFSKNAIEQQTIPVLGSVRKTKAPTQKRLVL